MGEVRRGCEAVGEDGKKVRITNVYLRIFSLQYKKVECEVTLIIEFEFSSYLFELFTISGELRAKWKSFPFF